MNDYYLLLKAWYQVIDEPNLLLHNYNLLSRGTKGRFRATKEILMAAEGRFGGTKGRLVEAEGRFEETMGRLGAARQDFIEVKWRRH